MVRGPARPPAQAARRRTEQQSLRGWVRGWTYLSRLGLGLDVSQLISELISLIPNAIKVFFLPLQCLAGGTGSAQETVEERRERKREAGEKVGWTGEDRRLHMVCMQGRWQQRADTLDTQRRDSGSMPGDGRQGHKRGCKREVQETTHRN